MRFREYKEDMGQFGYSVLGCDCHWDEMEPSKCQDLKMFLTQNKDGSVFTPWDKVIPFIDTKKPQYQYDWGGECYRDFYDHYAEILKGEYPGYRVIGFQCFYGKIEIIFARTDTRSDDEFSLLITNPECLEVTFIGPRTRLGFDPVYQISICRSPCCDAEMEGCDCLICEDSGLMRRSIMLALKDNQAEPDHWNTILDIEEYADI